MRQVFRGLVGLVVVGSVCSCGGGMRGSAAFQAPDAASATLLLKMGPDTFPTFQTGAAGNVGNLILAPYDPAGGVALKGKDDAVFEVLGPNPGGYRSVRVHPGTYAVTNFWVFPLWSLCFNRGSVAFEAKPGQVTYLGTFNTQALFGKVRDFADAHAREPGHPHFQEPLVPSETGSFMPETADTAQARAFVASQAGAGIVVEPAAFTHAAWQTEDNFAGVDRCSLKPPT